MQSSENAPTYEDIRDIVSGHVDREGPLMPILHDLQETFGYIPADAVPVVVNALNITKAELHGVISFYHDFRNTRAGRHVVKICRAEACQAVGGNVLAERTLAKLGVDWHGTTINGAVTVEPVYCLGLCACGPAAMVDGRVIGRIDAARMDEILKEAGA